jgi:2-dehydropantoate 2-reductase
VRIGLVGAGPVGTLAALSLLYNGVSFSWVVRNPERREQLDKLRFSLGGRSGELPIASLPMAESSGELAELDWCIFAVKAQHVASAIEHAGLVGNPRVLVVANGLQRGPFHLGLLYGGAYLDRDGALIAGMDNDLVVGNLGMPDNEIDELLAPLSSPFLHPIPDDLLQVRMWNKLALNCVVNPLTAIHDCPNGSLLERVSEAEMDTVLAEVDAVAEADCEAQAWTDDRWRDERFENSVETLRDDLLSLIGRTASNSSSMREDLRAGRETEIEALNGAVAILGQRYGIPCPKNAELAEQVRGLAGIQAATRRR